MPNLVIKKTQTFAAEMPFEHEGDDMSSRISSPSLKPLPKVGIGGVERPGLGGDLPLGTSEAVFGDCVTVLFIKGLAGITAPPEFCSTLNKSRSQFNNSTHLLLLITDSL